MFLKTPGGMIRENDRLTTAAVRNLIGERAGAGTGGGGVRRWLKALAEALCGGPRESLWWEGDDSATPRGEVVGGTQALPVSDFWLELFPQVRLALRVLPRKLTLHFPPRPVLPALFRRV